MKDLKSYILPTFLENTEENGLIDWMARSVDKIFLESANEIMARNEDGKDILCTDYAFANGGHRASVGGQIYKKPDATIVALRSSTYKKDEKEKKVLDSVGYDLKETISQTKATASFLSLRPAMCLDLQAGRDFKIFGTAKGEHAIKFGEFPSSAVINPVFFQNLVIKKDPNFVATGRTYPGYIKLDGTFSQHKEYQVNGHKFVQMIIPPNSPDTLTYDNLRQVPKTGEVDWFKVEPLVWIITNWEDLPKDINPDGSGTASEIKVVCQKAIMGGLPYVTNTINEHPLWEKSIFRGWLNGLDVSQRYFDYKIKCGDFRGKGFCDLAFGEVELEVNNQIVEENSQIENENVANAFGVTIDKTPITVKEQMKFYIENGMSFMLHGPSGVGKTRRVQEIDPNCIGITLRDGILPEEITGKTAFNEQNNTSSWIEPTWYTKLCKICNDDPEHYHVLFIDELTNTRAPEQSLAYNLILDHTIEIGRGELPKNCVVIAAGNSPEESSSANILSEPLFRRFVAHIELKPNLKEWLEWGSELKPDETPKIHPLVAAFVAANAEKVFYTKYDPDKPPKFAIDPRGWEQISDVIYKNNGVLRQKLLADKIGEENAIALLDYAMSVQISIKDIMEDKYSKKDIPTSFNEKFALICSLRVANEEQVKKVREFIADKLGQELLGSFDSMWVGEDDERALLIDEIESRQQKKGGKTEAKDKTSSSPKKDYKITIDEFWYSCKELAIHTNSLKQANTFCRIMYKKTGEEWYRENGFDESPRWNQHKYNTCYYNDKNFSDISYCKSQKIPVYEFDEVDFENYLEEDDEKY